MTSSPTTGIANKVFAITQDLEVTQCDNEGRKLSAPAILSIPYGTLFRVKKPEKSGIYYVIQILPYSSTGTQISDEKIIKKLGKQLSDVKKRAEVLKVIKATADSLAQLQLQEQGHISTPPIANSNPAREDAPKKRMSIPQPNASAITVDKISRVDTLFFTLEAKDFASSATDQFNYRNSFVV